MLCNTEIKFILNIDLENFFDSFNFGRVRGFFIKDRNFATSPEIATMIAQIACYQGKLPQGAPSSPIITNLITRILDYRIVKIAKKYRFTYTRYADDMTFSTNRDLFSNKLQAYNELDRFLEEVEAAILSSGFKINKEKDKIKQCTTTSRGNRISSKQKNKCKARVCKKYPSNGLQII